MIWRIFFIGSKLTHLRKSPEIFSLYTWENNRLKYNLKIGSITVKGSEEFELLGITIDKALNFRRHIENLFRTAQNKLHALRRIGKYLTNVYQMFHSVLE